MLENRFRTFVLNASKSSETFFCVSSYFRWVTKSFFLQKRHIFEISKTSRWDEKKTFRKNIFVRQARARSEKKFVKKSHCNRKLQSTENSFQNSKIIKMSWKRNLRGDQYIFC